MDKYTLLFVLNLPFIIFGVIKSITLYNKHSIKKLGLIFRITLWMVILFSLLYVRNMYSFLFRHKLTDSVPLSIADVVLTTGILYCIFLYTRLYSKLDATEKKLSDLHEKLSIKSSDT